MSELTWKRAIEISQAMESAEKQANNFKGVPAAEQINALRSRPKSHRKNDVKRERKPCFCCGGQREPQTYHLDNQSLVGIDTTKLLRNLIVNLKFHM